MKIAETNFSDIKKKLIKRESDYEKLVKEKDKIKNEAERRFSEFNETLKDFYEFLGEQFTEKDELIESDQLSTNLRSMKEGLQEFL